MTVPQHIKASGRQAVRIYLKAIKNGASPKMAEMFAMRRAPALDSDETHNRINRSGLSRHERAYIAKKARSLGMNEHVSYDPTLPPGHQLYETRAQADAAVAEDKAKADAREGKPVHRLHPRLVKQLANRELRKDPSLNKLHRKDLEADIIHKHSLPE